jgi:hypothetical protein
LHFLSRIILKFVFYITDSNYLNVNFAVFYPKLYVYLLFCSV